MASAEMRTHVVENIPIIQVSGYFEATTGEQVLSAGKTLLKKGKTALVLDISGCKVVNSPGISAILDLVLVVQDEFQGSIAIVGVNKLQHSVFEMAGIIPMAHLAESIEDGIRKLTEN